MDSIICECNLIVLELNIPKEIRKFIGNKNITNIYRIQAYHSIMCGYFFIGCIDFILKHRRLSEYKKIFSPKECKHNDKSY